MTKVQDLIDSIFEKYLVEKPNSRFFGFSSKSVNFFDDYPVQPKDASNWWSSKGGSSETSDYQMHLKPEFLALIEILIAVICPTFDRGFQTDAKQCVSRPNSKSGSRRFWPYYWGALHYAKRSDSDKSVEIQFFLNLTKTGLRVGVHFGKKPSDSGQWDANRRRFLERKEEIFAEIISLESTGYYKLVQTSDQDHAEGSSGIFLNPSDPLELYDFVKSSKEFTLLKTLPKDKLQSENLVLEILRVFAETRKLYELLESRRKINQRRLITGS